MDRILGNFDPLPSIVLIMVIREPHPPHLFTWFVHSPYVYTCIGIILGSRDDLSYIIPCMMTISKVGKPSLGVKIHVIKLTIFLNVVAEQTHLDEYL